MLPGGSKIDDGIVEVVIDCDRLSFRGGGEWEASPPGKSTEFFFWSNVKILLVVAAYI